MKTITPKNQLRTKAFTEYCYAQGQDFEKYISSLFNEAHFKIRRWRKSRPIPLDTYIPDMVNPDFEFIFTGKNNHVFAVECKWRSKFTRGNVDWASFEQIERYTRFERENSIPVFVAIGIGGIGAKPEKLYVTPLQNISEFPVVNEKQLIPYNRKPTNRFFYDTVQLKLW